MVRSAFHLSTREPDFLILDLNLPGMDMVAGNLQEPSGDDSNIPILMLTARVEETDRLIGLEAGRRLITSSNLSARGAVARVKTIFRRTTATSRNPIFIQVGELVIDLEEHTVNLAGKSIELTPTEFEILVTLAKQPKRVFSRLQIMEQAQGDAFEGIRTHDRRPHQEYPFQTGAESQETHLHPDCFWPGIQI